MSRAGARGRGGGGRGATARVPVAGAGLLASLPAAGHEELDAPVAASPEAGADGGGLLGLTRLVLEIQRRANAEVATHMNAIERGDDLGAFLLGLAIAFVYGVVHAFGPGHGKFVIVSYFLGREARIVRGVAMAVQIAVVHVIAAVVVVWLADLVLRSGFGIGLSEVPGVRAASFLIIVGIGVYMLHQAVRTSRSAGAEGGDSHVHLRAHGHGHAHGHDRGHVHADGHAHRHGDDRAHGHPHHQRNGHGHSHGHGHHHHHHHGHGHHHGGRVEGGFLALAAGMVPCPGAVLIMLYAVANDMIVPGFLLVAAMSLGIGLSICVLGIGAILARQTAMRVLEQSGGGRGVNALRNTLNYGGATFVTLIGLVSFVAFLDVPIG